MHQSFGEQDITWNSQIVGRLRVTDLLVPEALYPRLLFQVGCTLREHPADGRATATGAYHLIDLEGELRVREGGPVVTGMRWVDRDRQVRSLPFEDETQITLAGDLDFHLLEQLETLRNGEAPEFVLKLCPVLVGGDGLLPSRVHHLRIQIPRDRWTQFLERCGFGAHEIIEVTIPKNDSERLRLATAELRAAITYLRAGDYERVALLCRRSMDALLTEIALDRNLGKLKEFLTPYVGEVRATHYVELCRQLQALGNPAAHPTPHPYGRDEVQLLVRLTGSLVSLISRAAERLGVTRDGAATSTN